MRFHSCVLFLILLPLLVDAQCEYVDITTMTGICNGYFIDVSGLRHSGTTYYMGMSDDDEDGSMWFYQFVDGGLPDLQYIPECFGGCQWPKGKEHDHVGAINVGGRGGNLTSLGRWSKQVWTLDHNPPKAKLHIAFDNLNDDYDYAWAMTVVNIHCGGMGGDPDILGQTGDGFPLYQMEAQLNSLCDSPTVISFFQGTWFVSANTSQNCFEAIRIDDDTITSLDCEGNVKVGILTISGNILLVNYTYPSNEPDLGFECTWKYDAKAGQMLLFMGGANDTNPLVWVKSTEMSGNYFVEAKVDAPFLGDVMQLAVRDGFLSGFALDDASGSLLRPLFGVLHPSNTLYLTEGNGFPVFEINGCQGSFNSSFSCSDPALTIAPFNQSLYISPLQGIWTTQMDNCSITAKVDYNLLSIYSKGLECAHTGTFVGQATSNTTHLLVNYGALGYEKDFISREHALPLSIAGQLATLSLGDNMNTTIQFYQSAPLLE